MNWEIVALNLTNGANLEFFFSFYILALLGMLFSALLHAIKNENKPKIKHKYKPIHYITRFAVNLIAVYIFVLFHKYFTSKEMTMLIAFAVGLSIDKIIVLIQHMKFN